MHIILTVPTLGLIFFFLLMANGGQALRCYQQPWVVNLIQRVAQQRNPNYLPQHRGVEPGEQFLMSSLDDILAGEMLSDKCSAEEAGQLCFEATECQVPSHKKILANAFGVRVPDDVLMAEFRGCLSPLKVIDWSQPTNNSEYNKEMAGKLLHAGYWPNATADNFCELQKAFYGCAKCRLCNHELCNAEWSEKSVIPMTPLPISASQMTQPTLVALVLMSLMAMIFGQKANAGIIV